MGWNWASSLVGLMVCLASAALADTPQCLRETKQGKGTPESTAAALISESGIGETEIFVRLIFSETLASNCVKTSEEAAVVQGIAWILSNRAREPKRFGAGAAVVTAPKQFRSTFGSYDGARRKEFLCPERAGPEWQSLWTKAGFAWKAAADTAKNPLPGTHNYYLGRHFQNSKLKFSPPSWAKAPSRRLVPDLAGLRTDSQCIAFWKLAP